MAEDPYKTDLHMLRVLRAVYDLRSFSGAAETLGLSQSVVSYAIDRLRGTFGDPLFLRQGGSIVPTDRCVSIMGVAGHLLDEFETLITPEVVVPADLDRTFRVGCNFIERLLIVPLVAKALREAAPNVKLVIVQAGARGDRQLHQGATDLLIGPIRPESDRYYCRALTRDSYVCVMDPGNPLVGTELTLERYLAANRVEVSYGDEWTSDYRARIEPQAGNWPEPKVTVPSPGEIGRIISGTDLIATIPRLYAETLRSGLHVAEFPVASRLEIDLVWSRRTHGSAVHRWFRDLVVAAARPLQAASDAAARKSSSNRA